MVSFAIRLYEWLPGQPVDLLAVENGKVETRFQELGIKLTRAE